ncbi:dihydrofolate reductase family protein [Arthrobacter sp. NPDC055138]
MPKLRVHNFAVSLDGYAAGPHQSLADPLGAGGEQLHEWMFQTEAGERMIGESGGTTGPDTDFLLAGERGIGATIMGRNMFGPPRPNQEHPEWKGWWGDDPPFHHPVFVLTHHAQPPISMAGGTVFHFVDDGIESALRQAIAASHGQDIRLGGGAATVNQYLRAGLVDELHLAIVPVLLGSGVRLFENLDATALGYQCVQSVISPAVAHAVVARKAR